MSAVRNRSLASASLAAVLLLAVAAGAGPAIAQEDDEQPGPLPPNFHGNVTVDGEPAPDGVEVVALVDGEERASTTVGPGGAYAGSDWSDDKFVVDGSAEDSGSTVTFEVEGVEAAETAEWRAAASESVDLTVDELPASDDGGLAVGDGRGPPDDAPASDTEDGEGADDGESGANDEEPAERDDEPASSGANQPESEADGDDATPSFGVPGALLALLTVGSAALRREKPQ